jgi:hypothetical protein
MLSPKYFAVMVPNPFIVSRKFLSELFNCQFHLPFFGIQYM